MAASGASSLVCREIENLDLPGVVDCLARNFPRRSAAFWSAMFETIASFPSDPRFPRFGHLLQADARVVGVLIEIRHVSTLAGAPGPRCNLSSWCVDPPFRAFASALHRKAVGVKGMSYTNLTPAKNTREAVRAFGFAPYAAGRFEALAWLSPPTPGARLSVYDPQAPYAASLTAWERQMLADHRMRRVDALVGLRDGTATPIVIKRLAFVSRNPVPSALLLYCRGEADLVAFAGAIGRHCLLRGRARLLVSANGPIAGLPGRYVEGREPRFAHGAPPAVMDLAYSELALL